MTVPSRSQCSLISGRFLLGVCFTPLRLGAVVAGSGRMPSPANRRRSAAAEEGISWLKTGVTVLKHKAGGGAPQQTVVRLSPDETCLAWTRSGLAKFRRSTGERMVRIDDILEVLVGRDSEVFKRQQASGGKTSKVDAGQVHLSFSLLLMPVLPPPPDGSTAGTRPAAASERETLDLSCAGEEEFGLWLAAMRSLIGHSSGSSAPSTAPSGTFSTSPSAAPAPLPASVDSTADAMEEAVRRAEAAAMEEAAAGWAAAEAESAAALAALAAAELEEASEEAAMEEAAAAATAAAAVEEAEAEAAAAAAEAAAAAAAAAAAVEEEEEEVAAAAVAAAAEEAAGVEAAAAAAVAAAAVEEEEAKARAEEAAAVNEDAAGDEAGVVDEMEEAREAGEEGVEEEEAAEVVKASPSQLLPLPLPPSELLQALVVVEGGEAVEGEEATVTEAAVRGKATLTAAEQQALERMEACKHREEWEAQASDRSSQRADAIRRLSQLTSQA